MMLLADLDDMIIDNVDWYGKLTAAVGGFRSVLASGNEHAAAGGIC